MDIHNCWHTLQPIRSRSQNKCTETCRLDDVFPDDTDWRPWIWSVYSIYYHIHTCIIISEVCNPKMVFKIREGISCSSFSVKELDVIAHKNHFPCMTPLNSGHSVPTWLANLVDEVGTRHSHQILLQISKSRSYAHRQFNSRPRTWPWRSLP